MGKSLAVPEIMAALDFDAFYRSELGELQPGSDGQTLALCPFHSDNTPSLSICLEGSKRGLFNCFGCGAKGDVIDFIKHRRGCDFKTAIEELARFAGLEATGNPWGARVVAEYDYQDADGKLIFQVVRLDPKSFRQRRPDGKGAWLWKTKGIKLVPYRLPEVLKADLIFIVEGEKAADALAKLGLTATCSPGGAGKFRRQYSSFFKGKKVACLPDNDEPGRRHAVDVGNVLHGVAATFKVVELPGLQDKADVVDWLAGTGTREDLLALVEKASLWEPPIDSEPAPDPQSKSPTISDTLLRLVEKWTFFHDPQGEAWADIQINGIRVSWPILSKTFKSLLEREYYLRERKAPKREGLNEALGTIEARARHDGSERQTFFRLGMANGNVYLDLADDQWRAIEISGSGWRVIKEPPVRFRRSRGMMPLPAPERGGKLDEFAALLNLEDRDSWRSLIAWLVGALNPRGPYPVLVLHGEQGSAKSTTSKFLKALIDPAQSNLRAPSRDLRDLMISARHNWILAIDNISSCPEWLSDAFCRLSTGGGFAVRELYADGEEFTIDAIRPLILNGITAAPSRHDLADRSVLIELPPISGKSRRTEVEICEAFSRLHPQVLGVLCDAVATALSNYGKVDLPELPRMADFATWVVAAEPALPWPGGGFLEAYQGNRSTVVDSSLVADLVGSAILEFMHEKTSWEGRMSDFHRELEGVVPDKSSNSKSWPKAANHLTRKLKRLATFLRAAGIEIEVTRGATGSWISIKRGE